MTDYADTLTEITEAVILEKRAERDLTLAAIDLVTDLMPTMRDGKKAVVASLLVDLAKAADCRAGVELVQAALAALEGRA